MLPKVSVFVATSFDGYIAGVDGDIDWLNEANTLVPEGEDCGYGALMDSVDVLVMGRHTYEQVLSFGEWPYGAKPVIVLSSRSVAFPDDLAETVSHSSESPRSLCERLAREGVKHVYVDGGRTIQRFLDAGLVDEFTITVVPILLGGGIRLFGDLPASVPLRSLGSKSYDFGFVQLRYAVEWC